MVTGIFYGLHPVFQALFAGIFTWSITALGAAMVFVNRNVNLKVLDGMLGFAGGVMVAASIWSLLIPSIDLAGQSGTIPWLPAAAGFTAGWIFIWVLDKSIPHFHPGSAQETDGANGSHHRIMLLVVAITLHNIPEGLAIGIAFGAAAAGFPSAAIAGATALTIGIGIQNFPEGLAISMPLRRFGITPLKCFWYGQLSAVVEPVMAVVGAAVVVLASPILPYALSFAAGAMFFVVIEEVLPESIINRNIGQAATGFLVGFLVMMIIDVALG